MHLSEHRAFSDLTRAAASYFEIREELIIKDYWVTRALRAIASKTSLVNKIIFKGGTSLSKGFRLLERFSEDIDILLTGDGFGPVPDDSKERKSVLREIDAALVAGTGLDCPHNQFKGADREFWLVRFPYHAVYRYLLPGKAAVVGSSASDWIKVEPGYRGGPHPHLAKQINSFAAEFLITRQPEQAKRELSECEADFAAFNMELLAPSRTFAEKLLALDGGAKTGKIEARHYYDVIRLHGHDEVQKALTGGTFPKMVRDSIEIGNKYYGAGLAPSYDLRTSPALNLSGELLTKVKDKYAAESHLYFRAQPAFDEILKGVLAIRESLPAPLK